MRVYIDMEYNKPMRPNEQMDTSTILAYEGEDISVVLNYLDEESTTLAIAPVDWEITLESLHIQWLTRNDLV